MGALKQAAHITKEDLDAIQGAREEMVEVADEQLSVKGAVKSPAKPPPEKKGIFSRLFGGGSKAATKKQAAPKTTVGGAVDSDLAEFGLGHTALCGSSPRIQKQRQRAARCALRSDPMLRGFLCDVSGESVVCSACVLQLDEQK